MQYKMVVLDIDDTLLLPDGTMSEQVKNDLILAQERGIKVVLASGRPDKGMEKVAENLEFEKFGGFVIAFNGSKILNFATKEVIYEKNLTKQQVTKLYELAQKSDCFIQTYHNNEIIVSSDNPYAYIESEITGLPIAPYKPFLEAIPEECIKAIMTQAPKHLAEVEEVLKPQITDMSMTISKPYFLEFMNKEVDKGEAIKRLCEKLNISIDEVIAIGDSYNDISMIAVAGLGVAMGNAVQDVKDIANVTTKPNTEDGVSSILKQYVFNI